MVGRRRAWGDDKLEGAVRVRPRRNSKRLGSECTTYFSP